MVPLAAGPEADEKLSAGNVGERLLVLETGPIASIVSKSLQMIMV